MNFAKWRDTEWLTPADVAARLRLDEPVIMELVTSGALDGVQIAGAWRISESALRRLLVRSAPQRKARSQRLRALGGSIALVGLGLVAGRGFAQSAVTNASATIPYQGYLEHNNVPSDGPKVIIACLYRSEDSTDCIWTESQLVQLSAGRFTMGLGSKTPLDAVINSGGNLYLGLTVDDVAQGAPAGRPVTLAGRQLLGSAPFARRAAPGGDFAVDGRVLAAKVGIGTPSPAAPLDVVGESHFSSATVTGALRVEGAVTMPDATGNDGWDLVNDQGALAFRRAGQTQLALDAQGRVLGATYGFGGMFSRCYDCDGAPCIAPNPITKDCSCPTGFSASRVLAAVYGMTPFVHSEQVLCYR